MASAPRWLSELKKALSVPENKGQTVYQLATADPNGRPHVRTCVHRDIVQPEGYPNLPVFILTTDVRSPKISQLRANPQAEVAWWMAGSKDQFRIYGSVRIVASPKADFKAGAPPPPSLALDKMDEQGYDWEKKRVESFNSVNAQLKASWCRPVPGSTIGSYDEASKWPQKLPKDGEAQSEEEEQQVEQALKNCAIVLIETLEVDWVQLGVTPNQRTRFTRKEEEWVEEIVVA
ncbi:uncharacterized protein LAESUDRAFT_667058 [Laetiporus sulphureus 93-53]|uniref:Pyridoxamine 5'-phosphate oxidase Alr4036 family FMN-binding domain-containing protein n=1 Tax=Laetiporus sulphureus 93-53 TaxID=1314785 RepID=A0A165B0Y4_9APHY|nr:uncharacterized protein LAESUDRAFT_667058 [Laetiporus sulphureus 93-53]KZT00022.1 hypothetical protein LAESUDRAFT_667058 [Laetiporus sulphureus 93-53]